MWIVTWFLGHKIGPTRNVTTKISQIMTKFPTNGSIDFFRLEKEKQTNRELVLGWL